jgi:hypothetical protein
MRRNAAKLQMGISIAAANLAPLIGVPRRGTSPSTLTLSRLPFAAGQISMTRHWTTVHLAR